jgi:uncharacterized membrane protein
MTQQPPGPPRPPGGYPPPPPQGGGGYPQQGGGGYPQQGGGGYRPPQQPQGGGYPPPQPPRSGGGYPPPPQGYPPPPAGGVPPGGAPGYGGYGGQQPYSVGDAFNWAWNKFTKNAAALIVPALVYSLLVAVLVGIWIAVLVVMAPEPDYSTYETPGMLDAFGGIGGILVSLVFVIAMVVIVAAFQSAYVSGLLEIADGRPVEIGTFFRPRNLGSVLVAGLLVGIVVAIGYALCFIPGLIAAFLLIFTFVALLDRNLAPIDAMKASFEIVKNNVGSVLLMYLCVIAIIFVGELACGIGVIVAAPVAGLFQVYTYRRLSGGQVAPLTP